MDLTNVKEKLSGDLPLYISNKIIEAHFSLPLGEQRLLYAYISKISSEHFDFPELDLSISEFSKMIDLKEPDYKEIIKHATKLMDRKLEIETQDEWVSFHWFSICRYKKKEGRLIIKIHDELKPYLLQLKKHYTRLITRQVMQFRSVYSIRIYMICKKYQKLGKVVLSLEELKKKLGIDDGEYKLYGHFKKRVLEQAQKEINLLSDIEIDFQEVKEARKVVELLFYINKNNKTEAKLQGVESFTLKSMSELANLLCYEIKKRWKVDFPLKKIQHYSKNSVIELLCSILSGAYDEKTIPAPLAYFKAALENIENGKRW